MSESCSNTLLKSATIFAESVLLFFLRIFAWPFPKFPGYWDRNHQVVCCLVKVWCWVEKHLIKALYLNQNLASIMKWKEKPWHVKIAEKSCSSNHFCCILSLKPVWSYSYLCFKSLHFDSSGDTWVICMNIDSAKWIGNWMRLCNREFAACLSFSVTFCTSSPMFLVCLDVKFMSCLFSSKFRC